MKKGMPGSDFLKKSGEKLGLPLLINGSLNLMDVRGAQERQSIWGSTLNEWAAVSSEMSAVRIAAYDDVIAKAVEAGNVELAMIGQVVKESVILAQYQAKQLYGTPSEAFDATMAINFGTYKSALTKERELAVTTANGLYDHSISDGISDMVTGMIDGSMTIEEAFSNMLSSMADAFIDFATEILKTYLMNQLGSTFGGLTGGSTFGGTSSIWGSLTDSYSISWGFATGGIFPGGISARSRQIVDRPTPFMFAQGTPGIMGEAGPEAIIPVVRMPDGNYGVRTQGQQAQQAAPDVKVQNKVVNVLDKSLLGEFLATEEGENMVVNIVQRNRSILQA